MIKLADAVPIKEGGKLFGAAASRVSTSELNAVFKELQSLLSTDFIKMQLTRSLPTKEDHGDIDILVLGNQSKNPKKILDFRLGKQMVQYSKNGYTHSVLFRSNSINKDVHVDFIYVTDKTRFQSHYEYYSYNDFSGIVGIMARRLHFKYGTGGFQKRCKDIKGNWHDIPITKNLMKGLEVLGYKNAKANFDEIQGLDDLIAFVQSSPMLDASYFAQDELNQSDRKSVRLRRVIDYVVDKIRKSGQRAVITDEDYFFKKLMPTEFARTEAMKQKIDKETYIKSKYSGQWLMDKFGLKPGPQIGSILKALSDAFGEELAELPEDTVEAEVRNILAKN